MLVFLLSFLQTVTFAICSRARNRGNVMYNLIATFTGNLCWFMCFREVAIQGWDIGLLWYYCFGASAGSVVGVFISERIERWINASADGHLRKKTNE